MGQITGYLWQTIEQNIDWIIVLFVIASGYFQTFYTKRITQISGAIKTLILSFVVVTIYLFLEGSLFNKQMLSHYFFSYFMATSMYEIILYPITAFIQKKIKPTTDN